MDGTAVNLFAPSINLFGTTPWPGGRSGNRETTKLDRLQTSSRGARSSSARPRVFHELPRHITSARRPNSRHRRQFAGVNRDKRLVPSHFIVTRQLFAAARSQVEPRLPRHKPPPSALKSDRGRTSSTERKIPHSTSGLWLAATAVRDQGPRLWFSAVGLSRSLQAAFTH